MSEVTWLTPEAHKKLETELADLQGEGRRRMEERLAEARSHGDIRENADYDAAKNDQGLMEARIRQLKHVLSTAEVREVNESSTVVVGSIVAVKDSDGDETEYFVAPPENKVPGLLLASPVGPLGAALLGGKVGDKVSYKAPAGTFTVTIIGVRAYRG